MQQSITTGTKQQLTDLNQERGNPDLQATEQLITIGTKRQLIDLNQEEVNFDLQVTVDATDPGASFQAVVITQQELDEGMDINYRQFTGTMSARITNDKGIYENHFLCLKASAQVPVTIVTQFFEMPDPMENFGTTSYGDTLQQDSLDNSNYNNQLPLKPTSDNQLSTFSGLKPYATLKNGVIAVAIAAIIVGIYLLWSAGPNSSVGISTKTLISGLSSTGDTGSVASVVAPPVDLPRASVIPVDLPVQVPDLTSLPSAVKETVKEAVSTVAAPRYDRIVAKLQELVPSAANAPVVTA